MYKDNLAAAHAEIDSLKKKLGENKKVVKPVKKKPIPKIKKPYGYWWGRWSVFGDWKELVLASIIGPFILILASFICYGVSNDVVNEQIQKAMCISIFGEKNQRLISQEAPNGNPVLKCRFLSFNEKTKGSVVDKLTINPAKYM